ncbi:MAG TPA: hypothetical protein VE913_02655 [Longimicrobium sp.]|nr:hypothetical protein [Longimicrobium sp.]
MRHRALLLAACASVLAAPAVAQSMAFSGDPGVLVVGAAAAGSPPEPATESSTTYTLAGVTTATRITARLTASLPAGVTLRVTLAAPAGAVSAGPVTLSPMGQEVVRMIPAGSHGGLAITYHLSAPTSTGPVPLSFVSVEFTLVSEP